MTEPVISVGTPSPEAVNALWEAVMEWKLEQLSTAASAERPVEIENEVPVSAVCS